ncbi:transcription factor DP [Striga asiatica]|uniref:Transcription factor DP n=1 Tax=Striga asiatica TaxID=4170 RepID=A0A5A7PDB9_STRAF|nr:transcription factor DP [Striga asiatica]
MAKPDQPDRRDATLVHHHRAPEDPNPQPSTQRPSTKDRRKQEVRGSASHQKPSTTSGPTHRTPEKIINRTISSTWHPRRKQPTRIIATTARRVPDRQGIDRCRSAPLRVAHAPVRRLHQLGDFGPSCLGRPTEGLEVVAIPKVLRSLPDPKVLRLSPLNVLRSSPDPKVLRSSRCPVNQPTPSILRSST